MKIGFQTIVWGPRVRAIEYILDVIAAAGYQGMELFQRLERKVLGSIDEMVWVPCGPDRYGRAVMCRGRNKWEGSGSVAGGDIIGDCPEWRFVKAFRSVHIPYRPR